jgi:hypothetical protein
MPNRVYIDLIKNIEHVHMNGTEWTTLSEFVESMVKKHRLKVVMDGSQTFIQYIGTAFRL